MAAIKRTFRSESDGKGTTDVQTTTYDFWAELVFVVVVGLVALILCLAGGKPDVQVDIHQAPVSDVIEAPPVQPSSARMFAALAVYHQATGDDYLQRAVIAQTALNAYSAGGAASQVRGAVAPAGGTFNADLWQSALDVVDAVASGDYVIVPEACTRATAVVSQSDPQWPGALCTVSGLAFVEPKL